MRPPRRIRAVVVPALLCAAWACISLWPWLLIRREFLRLGELLRITPTGPGSRLSGQILGFNYYQPPVWYHWTALIFGAALWMAPAYLPAAWLARGRSPALAPSRVRVARAAVALLLCGVLFTVLDQSLSERCWLALVDLGESLGGTVNRISGHILIQVDGPFTGGRPVDVVMNLLARHLPRAVWAGLAATIACALHTRLARNDHLRHSHLCLSCGYDLSATPAGLPCPECGGPPRGMLPS